MTMHHISSAIEDQLVTLRDKKGAIAIEDVSGILENVADMMSGSASGLDTFLREEIIKIANHIETTKNEISGLVPESSTNRDMGTAAMQLDAVMKATEQAAHTIMDAADEIQNVIATATMDQAAKDKITEIAARIYEACNFQDLTGQRITKVMRALEFTESKIRRLISLFSNDGNVNMAELQKAHTAHPDAHLLNGPQLPGNAPSQTEVDTLFGKTK